MSDIENIISNEKSEDPMSRRESAIHVLTNLDFTLEDEFKAKKRPLIEEAMSKLEPILLNYDEAMMSIKDSQPGDAYAAKLRETAEDMIEHNLKVLVKEIRFKLNLPETKESK